MEIRIAPFEPRDQLEVKQLILAGLAEHFGFLDPTKNSDLEDIATSYAHATFLVAHSQTERCIVGCGALVPRSPQHGEIVRMSVRNTRRGQGIGTMLLNALIDAAHAQGMSRIILETTETWDDAIAFYTRNQFRITHFSNGEVYFERWL
ncbi:MAG TPA: GNAT family N-acetyltransferase [Anaerolineae bacterium]|nr:GNAT family N-acetyltransferase [Anaerolineae bacterium]